MLLRPRLVVLGLLIQLSLSNSANAQPATRPPVASPQAAAVQRWTEEGNKALQAGDLQLALGRFEQAYVSSPKPELLYALGRVAQAEGRGVAAADLYRRYLAAAGDDVSPSVRATLQQQIASVSAKEPTTELEVISGDSEAVLRIDGRVAGILPLSAPLLITAGEHRFTVEKEGRKFQTSPQLLPPGQRAQLQLTLRSRYAVLTLPEEIPTKSEPELRPVVAAATETRSVTKRRPHWRLIVGSVGVGAGALLGGFGISALAAQGNCISAAVAPAEICANVYSTTSVGGTLLGVGTPLLLGSVLLIAWPPR